MNDLLGFGFVLIGLATAGIGVRLLMPPLTKFWYVHPTSISEYDDGTTELHLEFRDMEGKYQSETFVVKDGRIVLLKEGEE